MNIADTDDIVERLFQDLQDNCGSTFKTYGRRILPLKEINEQPALFVRHNGDEDDYSGEGLPLTTIEAEIFIYSNRASDPKTVPDTGLSGCVQAVRAAISTIEQRNTLGESVYRCRIEGRSDYDPGDANGQAAAAITVKILVPTFEE